jgi:hypothetical protein
MTEVYKFARYSGDDIIAAMTVSSRMPDCRTPAKKLRPPGSATRARKRG